MPPYNGSSVSTAAYFPEPWNPNAGLQARQNVPVNNPWSPAGKPTTTNRNKSTKMYQPKVLRTPPRPKQEKKVKFDNVFCRSYPRMLGDHPCAQGGSPLSMGLKPISDHAESIDEYEKKRESRPKPGSKASRVQNFHLSLSRRRSILIRCGTPKHEWDQVEAELKSINESRSKDLAWYQGFGRNINYDDDEDSEDGLDA